MRDRRRRGRIDPGTGGQRKGDSGGGLLSWVRTHVLGSIVGAALIASATAWLGGFFDSVLRDVLPSGQETFCALRETIENWAFAPPVPPVFTILIARIDFDEDRYYTHAIVRAFLQEGGIERVETCRVLRIDASREAPAKAMATARGWLQQRHADLLIGGELRKEEKTVAVWFIGTDPEQSFQQTVVSLDALRKEDFAQAAGTRLSSIALVEMRSATGESGKDLLKFLKQAAVKLENLLAPATPLIKAEEAELQEALGLVKSRIGILTGDRKALVDATTAYRAALKEWTRDRAPHQWAETQMNLGNTLAVLGEQESGTVLLEEAVAAYGAALEESPRGQMPFQWARTQMNLGNALVDLGKRESGTTSLEKAVTAYRAALEERTRDRVPLQWATTQHNLGAAFAAIGKRESGTTSLERAVAAYRAALEERTRDRVPLQWAKSTGYQGIALMLIAERLSDVARARSAIQQIDAASKTMRERGDAHEAAELEDQLRSIAERSGAFKSVN